MLGTEYPIWLAGMGGVSVAPLVAAISNAGELGVIGAATPGPEGLRRESRKTRELTDKPFAVDLLAPIPDMIGPHMRVHQVAYSSQQGVTDYVGRGGGCDPAAEIFRTIVVEADGVVEGTFRNAESAGRRGPAAARP